MAQFFKGKVKTGAGGGGLKKGGLKGLKAKKEAKQAAKEDSAKAAAPASEAVTKKEEPAKSESPVPEKKVSCSLSGVAILLIDSNGMPKKSVFSITTVNILLKIKCVLMCFMI